MKQIKLFGVLAIALTLGLAACNGGGNEPGDQSKGGDVSSAEGGESTKHKHDWGEYVVTKPATCTEDGQEERTCKGCGEKQTKTIKAAHTWSEWEVVTPSTCAVAGSEKRTCSVCNKVETRELALAEHTYAKDADGNDVVVWTQEADCENAGSGSKTCTVCGHEEPVSTQALGHSFKTDADGNIEFTWTVAPSCEKAGVGTKHCTRCDKDIAATEEEAAALGHDIEAIGGETTPTDGTAAVRLYHCKRCNQTYMGFLANEVTNESKEHVYFEPETVAEGEEQGARFKGRPIGNALALDETGTSVNQQNGECVYCSTETGDFIEYAFNLNKAQADELATCRLYCDAKPANYLNGTDFWAYGRSNDEWTPGFYIDGGDERFETNEDGTFVMTADHEKAAFDSQPGAEKKDADGNPVMVKQGKRIEDYRYVLYVDDKVVDFDPDTANPTHGSNQNMQREEFVLPYTFHLHEGLNKIKFVMAGGYRSLFYKCIFRPYVAPTPIVVNETALEVREGKTAQITSSMEGLTYRSSNTSICTVDDKGVVTGVKAGEATITVSKEGNFKDAKVAVKVLEKEGIITLNLADGVIAPEGGFEAYHSNSSGDWLRNAKKDATLTYTFQSEVAGKFDIQLGLRGSGIVLAENFEVKVNDVAVALEGTVNTQYSAVDYIVGQADLKVGENTMVIKALADNSMYLKTLKFVPHQYVAFKTYSIEDLEANRTDSGWAASKDFGETGKGFKFNKAGSVTVKYTAEAAGKAMLQLKIAVKQSNNTKTQFWKQIEGEPAGGTEKTRITINGTAVTPGAEPDFSKSVASSVNDSGIISTLEWYNIIEIDLVAGENTIQVEFLKGGYSYYLGGIALAK